MFLLLAGTANADSPHPVDGVINPFTGWREPRTPKWYETHSVINGVVVEWVGDIGDLKRRCNQFGIGQDGQVYCREGR